MQAPEQNSVVLIAGEYIEAIKRLPKTDRNSFDSIKTGEIFEQRLSASLKYADVIIDKGETGSGLINLFFEALDAVVSIAFSDKSSLENNLVLRIVGIVNNTKSRIAEALNLVVKEVVLPPRVAEPKLTIGSSGAEVKQLQEWFGTLGFSTFADGSYGPATERIVLQYKKSKNLPETPDIDDALFAEIEREASAITEQDEIEEAVPQPVKKKAPIKKQNPQTKPESSGQLESNDEKNKVSTGYWLLRINPRNWKIENMEPGVNAWHNTRRKGTTKRVEYDDYLRVKPGDKIIGYAFGDLNEVVCVFTATEGVHMDVKHAEIISMQISEVFDSAIPLASFSNKIDFEKKLLEGPERLLPLTKEQYDYITGIKNGATLPPGSPPSPPTNAKKIYQALLSTEGAHNIEQDQLEFENDVASLASVIAHEDVKPPLAIGLFGNWGSGKSFFMEKLLARIDAITDDKNDKYVKNDKNVKNVVQVKFNSWHYSDSNLWASLITEIFDSLHQYSERENKKEDLRKLSDTLHITSLQKEEAEKKKKELEERVNQLKEKRDAKRERLEDISGIKLLKLVLSDKLIQKDLDELNNGNIETIVASGGNVSNYITQVQDSTNQAKYIWRSFADMKGGRWLFVVAVAIIVFGLSYLFKEQFDQYWKGAAAGITIIATAFAQFIKIIGPARKVLNETVTRLKHLQNSVNTRPDVPDAELDKEEKELKYLSESLQHIDEKLTETRKEITDIQTGKRLLEFIQTRSQDESYARQLGLISWIRKDFKRLDELLRKQYDSTLSNEERNKLNPTDVKLQIDRIVLYIDDLDRCKEEIVVKVLEAIHLLLAFPLFVVVVGVDPRWLNNALAEQYKAMFKENNGVPPVNDIPLANTVATTYDYLEKIFQVPFALKPINKKGQGDLIAYLLKNEMEEEKKPEPPPSPAPDKKDMTGGTPAPKDQPQPTPDVDEEKRREEERQKQEEERNRRAEEERKKKEEEEKKQQAIVEKLTFSADELKYLQQLSPIFGHTPRAINRYVNIYRIIKSHQGLKINGAFDEDEYIPVMFILAIIVGHSVFAKEFIDVIANTAENNTLEAILKEVGQMPEGLDTAIGQCLDDKALKMTAEPFKRNLELISRFSFRTIMC